MVCLTVVYFCGGQRPDLPNCAGWRKWKFRHSRNDVFLFTFSPAPATPDKDNSSQATVLSGGSLAVTGTTIGATCELGELVYGVDSTNKTVWYSWTAPASGDVHVTANAVGSSDLTAAIYAGSSLWNLTPVVTGSDITFYALGGATYKIDVVGQNGLSADFTLTVDGQPPDPSIDPSHTVRLSNGNYQVRVTGVAGQSFIVQASSDSVHWIT